MILDDMFEIDDIKNNRIFAVLSYIPFFFLIPLIVKRNSKFVKFSLNQGVSLFIVSLFAVILQILLRLVFTASMFTGFLVVVNVFFAIFYILIASFLVDGIINATKEKAKKLPLASVIKIFKL